MVLSYTRFLYWLLHCLTNLNSFLLVFGCPQGADPGLPLHPTIFGCFGDEIHESEKIKTFVTMGSKNYCYERSV